MHLISLQGEQRSLCLPLSQPLGVPSGCEREAETSPLHGKAPESRARGFSGQTEDR